MSTAASVSADRMNDPMDQPLEGVVDVRTTSKPAMNRFMLWTAFWWTSVGVLLLLFYVGQLDFLTSTKLSLYGISIWLNAWILIWYLQKNGTQTKSDLYHDILVIWMLSYAITNVIWEIPWIILSPIIFTDINTVDDIVAQTEFMRETPLNLYWWMIASFGSVDLRTVNHDSTFYTLELYAFINVISTIYFFHLNKKRSPYRYLIPVLGCGEPVASTFIFSFSEVFGGFVNMPGGTADTLLALVWTQYQYFVFPLIFGYLGYRLLLEDWRRCFTNK